MRSVATGFAAGDHAVADIAVAAVKAALANTGSDYAHSVILLLSGHFARHAQPAVTAASRTARCLQISGCTVPGLFTEQSWALNTPAAAALVFSGPISLGLPRDDEARLTFAQPSQANAAWIADGQQRFGTLATDGEGDADGQAWTQGKVASAGRIEAALHGTRLRLGVSRGISALTPPLQITDSDGFEILQLGDETALDSLLRHLDPEVKKLSALPPQRIFAAVPEVGVDAQAAFDNNRYTLLPILQVNRDERSITLATPLPLHSSLLWVMRDPLSAERDMVHMLDSLPNTAPDEAPAFGLMFSCIGRGPYFYQGHDRDVALVRERFPDMPLLGAYCSGEIAPIVPHSDLISYSTVLSVGYGHV